MQNSTHEIADLQKTKVNTTKIRKVHADGNKLRTGKEWRYMPSGLSCRSILVVRQADENLAVSKNFKIQQL